eukprot:ANDGO_05617.mRNA.1 hypothetical protein
MHPPSEDYDAPFLTFFGTSSVIDSYKYWTARATAYPGLNTQSSELFASLSFQAGRCGYWNIDKLMEPPSKAVSNSFVRFARVQSAFILREFLHYFRGLDFNARDAFFKFSERLPAQEIKQFDFQDLVERTRKNDLAPTPPLMVSDAIVTEVARQEAHRQQLDQLDQLAKDQQQNGIANTSHPVPPPADAAVLSAQLSPQTSPQRSPRRSPPQARPVNFIEARSSLVSAPSLRRLVAAPLGSSAVSQTRIQEVEAIHGALQVLIAYDENDHMLPWYVDPLGEQPPSPSRKQKLFEVFATCGLLDILWRCENFQSFFDLLSRYLELRDLDMLVGYLTSCKNGLVFPWHFNHLMSAIVAKALLCKYDRKVERGKRPAMDKDVPRLHPFVSQNWRFLVLSKFKFAELCLLTEKGAEAAKLLADKDVQVVSFHVRKLLKQLSSSFRSVMKSASKLPIVHMVDQAQTCYRGVIPVFCFDVEGFKEYVNATRTWILVSAFAHGFSCGTQATRCAEQLIVDGVLFEPDPSADDEPPAKLRRSSSADEGSDAKILSRPSIPFPLLNSDDHGYVHMCIWKNVSSLQMEAQANWESFFSSHSRSSLNLLPYTYLVFVPASKAFRKSLKNLLPESLLLICADYEENVAAGGREYLELRECVVAMQYPFAKKATVDLTDEANGNDSRIADIQAFAQSTQSRSRPTVLRVMMLFRLGGLRIAPTCIPSLKDCVNKLNPYVMPSLRRSLRDIAVSLLGIDDDQERERMLKEYCEGIFTVEDS